MCGINGIVAYGQGAAPVAEAELLRVRDSMVRRGPDGAGAWLSADRRVGLAHRRLSVIDLSEAGAQPMASADGRFRITYNGEIYNYQELKAGLESSGRRFRSGADTEVLLQLFEERGPQMLSALRGMYAFAIWDERERRLFLARDPLGIKPLYYANAGGALRFASQVKALIAGGSVSEEIEPAGYAGFFLWGSVPEPYTLYRGIRALPAGQWLAVGAAGVDGPRQFHSLRQAFAEGEREAGSAGSPAEAGTLGDAITDSVKHHLVADVPVGVFLSAGIDSAMLAGLAARFAPLRSITLGFDEYCGSDNDETVLAEASARTVGLRHETRWISYAAFRRDTGDILAAMDQPSIDGLNTYLVAAAAKQAGMKVALSGVGGDELFAGYPSFRQVPRLASALGGVARAVPVLARAMRRVADPVLRPFASPKLAGLAEYGGSVPGAYLLRRALFMPWELPRLLDPDIAKAGLAELATLDRLNESIAGISNPRFAVSCLEMTWYMRNQLLRDTDWAGMAHSLEIRVPFADAELLRRAIPFLARGTPPSKREIARSLCPSLPKAVLERPKTGFTVPVREWLARTGEGKARGLRGWAGAVFSDFRRDRRALCLVADAYGDPGGIAKFNRDLLESLCGDARYLGVNAIARNSSRVQLKLPAKLAYRSAPAGGLIAYAYEALRAAAKLRSHDMIVCGHLNLLPFAGLAKALSGARLVLNIYGIDAWTPSRRWLIERLVGSVDMVVSISRFTFEKFRRWAGNAPADCFLLPCCVDLERFTPGDPPPGLAQEYGVAGRKVILSLARLNALERYKGVDEVLEILPRLRERVPGIAYLVAGDGSDLARLRAKAEELGIAGDVRFLGYVDEARKPDVYRLANAFVMAGRGEGFGIVYIEALACGVPVVGSTQDASRETLLEGKLGTLVDPDDRNGMLGGIVAALSSPAAARAGLARYSRQNFAKRVIELGDSLWRRAGSVT
ncbi:MAG TPA: asparagine synthase (glutamine-hydrolyzing) [Burkholderiales bacterium]|nr:asparagine synthase (glutamine-hydrolyzing) [Burkholderiales bacterium]